MILSTVLLYATLASCAVIISLIVVKYDLYEREPWYMLLAAVALGAAGMWLAGQAEVLMIRIIHDAGHLVTNTHLAVMAGVTEELAKLGAVAVVVLTVRRHFNEPIDGLIYGSFAGLGAAIEESVAILRQIEPPIALPLQEPVRLAGHLVMGGIGGFGMGFLATRSRWAALAITGALAVAIVLHIAWDLVAFDAADHFRRYERLLPWHTAAPIGLMLVGMIVYRALAAAGKRLTRVWVDEARS